MSEKTTLSPEAKALHDQIRQDLVPFGEKTWLVTEQRWLYVDKEDSASYLKLMEDPVYSFGFHAETVSLMALNADRFLNHKCVVIFDLGPGYPDKIKPVLEEAQKRGINVYYVPVDISPDYLDISCKVAERYVPKDRIYPLNITFQELGERRRTDPKLAEMLALADKAYLNLGLTIMNFTREQYVSLFNSMIIDPKDEVVVAAEFINNRNPIERIIPQYQTGREFTFSPLKHLGFNMEDASFDVRYANERLEMSHIFNKSAKGHEISFEAGDRVITAFSYRKDVRKFLDDLKKDFNIRGGDISLFPPDNSTGLAFLQKKTEAGPTQAPL